jgi:hypothetical protein
VIGNFSGLLLFLFRLRRAYAPRAVSSSETLSAADLLRVTVEEGRFPLVRLVPRVGPERRSGSHGPFYERSDSRHAARWVGLGCYLPRELLDELLSLSHARARLAGAQTVVSRITNTWSAVFQLAPSDLNVVVAALEALLLGDEQPLRDYLAHPPRLVRAGEVLAPHGRQLG